MVAILLGEGFEESEALVPADLLRRAGLGTARVGVAGRVVRGSHGIAVQADLALEQVDPDELDMLVLPGGMGGVASIQMNLVATALIQRSWERGLYLAAICAAPTILAGMGILDRRRAVCYPGMEDEMGSAVVRQGQHVVVDGHIITAEAAGSAFEFGLKLVEILSGRACAEQVKQEVHYHY